MPAPSSPPTAAVLLKANALIDKALSTHSTEEARTCALTAAKMIRQYGISLHGEAVQDPKATEEAVLAGVKRATRLIRDRLEVAEARAAAAEARAAAAEARVKQIEMDRVHHDHAETVKDLAGRWMRTRFASACRKCRVMQSSGEKVWWLGAKKGILCGDCWWKRQHQRAV